MPNLQNHTTSYELLKELHDLCKEKGIKLPYDALFWYWIEERSQKTQVCLAGNPPTNLLNLDDNYRENWQVLFQAYISSELSEILNIEMTDANESESYTLRIESAIDFWNVYFGNDNGQMSENFEDTSLSNALCKLLIHAIKNNLIEL